MLIINLMWSVLYGFTDYLLLLRMQPVCSNLGNLMDFSDTSIHSQSMMAHQSSHSREHKYVKVFLVFDVGHKRRQPDFDNFFTKSVSELEQRTAAKPLFFNEEKALQYMRFVDSGHCILTAYVPEPAIEGHFDELSLRKGYLNFTQIQGCYPSYAKGEVYLSNPTFDTSILRLARVQEDNI